MILQRGRLRFVPPVLVLLLGGTASAEMDPYDPKRYVTEERVKNTYDAVRKVLSPAQSPISEVDARRIVLSAVLSALGEKCHLPWAERIYLPMMAHYRHTRGLSEREMKVLGVIHGFMQGSVLNDLPEGSCPPDIRNQMSKAMSAAP